MQALVMSPEIREAIAALRDFADDSVNRNIIQDILDGRKGPPGDDPRHVIKIPFGYRVVYSVDLNAEGHLWRHLSVSLDGLSKLPNPEAVFTIAAEFGFDRERMSIHLQDQVIHVVEALEIH